MTDNRKIRMNSPAEDAAITAAALADPDNPPLTGERLARMRRDPEKAARMKKKTRGPQKAPTKVDVHIKLDPDVIAHFKADGGGWQTRVNAALRKAAGLDPPAKVKKAAG